VGKRTIDENRNARALARAFFRVRNKNLADEAGAQSVSWPLRREIRRTTLDLLAKNAKIRSLIDDPLGSRR
jgi:hypothetical protein